LNQNPGGKLLMSEPDAGPISRGNVMRCLPSRLDWHQFFAVPTRK
jgi:hypothetical protein